MKVQRISDLQGRFSLFSPERGLWQFLLAIYRKRPGKNTPGHSLGQFSFPFQPYRRKTWTRHAL